MPICWLDEPTNFPAARHLRGSEGQRAVSTNTGHSMTAPSDGSGHAPRPRNEQDVRETIIRPLLHALGYRQGTEADIITEYRLTYDAFFLGHKSKRDPILRGDADYVCQVVGTTRWIVEAKPPTRPISQRDVQQAFSYAAHPDVAAPLFLVTNGREFRLYQTQFLGRPALEWTLDDMAQRMDEIGSVLSPEAIRRRYKTLRIEGGRSVGLNLGERAKIAGGVIMYREFFCLAQEALELLRSREGARSSIREGIVYRTPDGSLRGEILVSQSDAKFDALARLLNLECFSFESAGNAISSDRARPTVFTGQTRGRIPAGTDIGIIPGAPARTAPIDVDFVTDIRVIGFLERDHIIGAFDYAVTYSADLSLIVAQFREQVVAALARIRLGSWGDFDLTVMDVESDEFDRVQTLLLDARRKAGR